MPVNSLPVSCFRSTFSISLPLVFELARPMRRQHNGIKQEVHSYDARVYRSAAPPAKPKPISWGWTEQLPDFGLTKCDSKRGIGEKREDCHREQFMHLMIAFPFRIVFQGLLHCGKKERFDSNSASHFDVLGLWAASPRS